MTIRIYPSRLEGEPLETHETTGRLSIADWLRSVAPGFSIDAQGCHPTIRVNGDAIPPTEWELTYFRPSDQVDVYLEARGDVIAIATVVLSLVAIAMMLTMRSDTPSSRRQGETLDSPGQLANRVRWGDPVPEIAGSPLTYPDYILPPRRYYRNRVEQWVDSVVCVGRGKYLKDITQVFIGETPAPNLGDNLEVRFFEPGETIPAPLNEWWHTPEEVGFTSLGGTGMTLGPAEQVAAVWTDSISFAGTSITGDRPVPASWQPGLTVRVEADHPVTFNGNSIQSALLDTLGLTTGDEIEITGERAGEYTLSAILPASGGSPGSPATVTGSVPPARLDFGESPATLNVSLFSSQFTVALTSDVDSLSDLVAAMNAQLNGTPIRARSAGSVLELYQVEPFNGGSISVTGDVVDLLGQPTLVAGTAATPAVGAQYIVSGADFGTGVEVTAVGRAGLQYTITGVSGNSVTVSAPDVAFWPGFPADVSGATSGIEVDPGSVEGGWIGPFVAAPLGRDADAFEVDIFYPGGLIRYNKKGRIREQDAGGTIQWRFVGATTWVSVPFHNWESTPDQIGFTYRVDHAPGRVEVRVRAHRAPSSDANISNTQQWSGLRSRVLGAPTSYPGWTTAYIRMRSGDKVSGAVENKIAIRPVRILPTVENPDVEEPTRDIAPFFIHMMDSVGYGRDLIDMPHIESLHQIWRSRGDTFDLVTNASSTLKTVAGYALQAGFAELTLRRGLISAARDAYRMGPPPRVYSPQELVSPLIESTEAIMPDDIDGVDIEYVDRITGRTLTESYRLIGDLGRRVEKITAPGVTGRTQAWRLAARRRRMAAYRRTAFKGTTELAAMNSFYMDYVGLQDGIPEWGQSAFVIGRDGLSLTLSEPPQSVDGELVAMLRRPDGTATGPIPVVGTGERSITLAGIPADTPVSDDPNAPTVVYLGQRTRVVHEALITEVRPNGDSRVDVHAVNMDNRVYIEDDMGPDQVILTSMPYAIIFSDGIAPQVAPPAVRGVPVPRADDTVSIGLEPPVISRRTAVRYLTYEDGLPESIGIGLEPPVISRRTAVRYLTYEDGLPESIGIGLEPPVISRKTHPVYEMAPESIGIGLEPPAIKRMSQ